MLLPMGIRLGSLCRGLTAILAVLLAHALAPHAASAQAPPPGVFAEIQNAIVPRPNTALEPATMRSRVVQVDTQKITAARRGREVLKLNLFDDAVIDVAIKRVRPTQSGYFISGTPEGMEWGEVRLVINGPVMVGTVETPEGKFTIRSAGSNRHIVRQIDARKEPFECGVEEAPPAVPSSLPAIASKDRPMAGIPPLPRAQTDESPTEDGSEVRVLVVYTSPVQAKQGGAAGMRALIDLYMQSANQAFEDSGISPRLVLAHSAPVDYSGVHPRTDLYRLRNPEDGHMDEVHALRNKHAADLVHLLTDAPTTIRGIAFLLRNESLSYEESAFAVSAVDSEEVFTHEIGHNFGVAHDRYVHGALSTIYPYSHGYVNEKAFEPDASPDTLWHTVMAYDDRCSDAGFNCERLLRFSNPDQSNSGDPLGVSADDPATGLDGPADARLTANNTAKWVGSLRSEACTSFAVKPEAVVAPVNGGEIALKVEAGDGCVWEASTQTGFLAVTSGAYSAGSSILKVHVEANQSGSERNGTLTVAGNTITLRQLAIDKGICARTPNVVLAIIEEISSSSDPRSCDEATPEELAGVNNISLFRNGITSLKPGDFDGLSGLRFLNMETNSIRELPDGIFDDLKNLEGLYIGGNELSELPEGILDKLTKLKNLDLENMNLTTLPEGAFSNLANLESLQLNVNDITHLPAGLLAGLSRLDYLDIHGNEIKGLPNGFFADLSSLENLKLHVNRLEDLPAGAFSGLSSLQQLELDSNRLTELPEGLFSGSTSLKKLILDSNRLTELPEGLFAGLSNLEELGLRRNRLTVLPSGLFAGLSNLESLALSFNRLVALPDGVFDGLANLNLLDLYGNDLVDLAANQFSGLSALENLFIGGNKINRLPAALFSELPGLTHLSLTDNQLSSLPDGIFSGLASLETLRLGGNVIDPFSLTLSLEKVGQDQFKAVFPAGSPFRLVVPVSVGDTGVIEGDANNITIPAGALESDPKVVERASGKLEGVSLNFGPLPARPRGHVGYELYGDESLPLLVLPSISPEDATLRGITLGEGELSPVFSTDTKRYRTTVPNSTSKLTVGATTSNANATIAFLDADLAVLADADALADGHQVSLLVGENTIHVKATSEDGAMTETYRLVVTRDVTANVCVRSDQVKEAILTELAGVDACGDLTAEHLLSLRTLDLSGREISSLLERDLAGLISLEELNLSNNRLHSLPSGIFSGLTRLKGLRLNNNRFFTLPPDVFASLTDLESLQLYNNRLIDLPIGVFSGLDALKELNLSFNSLTQVRSGVFSGLKNLNSLTFGANDITELPANLFEGLLNLQKVVINSAELQSLPEGVFAGLSELRTIELGRNRIAQLPPSIFSGLSSLRVLHLRDNRISSLPAEVFSGLTSLAHLWLSGNRLSELPPGILSGLTALAGLDLSRNAVPLVPLPVSIEKVGNNGFRAVAPTGAPFTFELPVTINESGQIEGAVHSLSISQGMVESAAATVTRVAGTEAAVTVDIGELPALPRSHEGYSLQKDGALPTTILPGPKSPPPDQVTGVQVIPGAEQLEVSWVAVSGADGYKIQWKSGVENYSDVRQAVTADGETTTHTITGLTGGTEYTVRVIATKDQADDGLPSAEVIGTPTATQPAQVTGVEVMPGVEQLNVSWAAVSNASGYKVQWKSGDEDYDESRQAVLSGGDIVTHTIMDLTAGTEYTVRVIATNTDVEDGTASEEVTGVPKAQTPAQVTGVAVEPGLEEIDVSWTAVSDADGYKVEWKSGSEDYAEDRQVTLLGGETITYTIIDLTADTEYTLRVIATREHADDGSPSEEVTATPVSADPDVNGDGTLDGNDALIMYNSYASEDRLGDGETGGTAASRQSLLAGYSGKDNPSDDELKEMIRNAHAWQDAGLDVGGDINEDGEIDESDAFVMYYAYANANLVGNGTTGGTARFRQLLLAAFANKDNPTDEDLKAMLKRANKLREDFG